jgi:hypothetical protein
MDHSNAPTSSSWIPYRKHKIAFREHKNITVDPSRSRLFTWQPFNHKLYENSHATRPFTWHPFNHLPHPLYYHDFSSIQHHHKLTTFSHPCTITISSHISHPPHWGRVHVEVSDRSMHMLVASSALLLVTLGQGIGVHRGGTRRVWGRVRPLHTRLI